MKILLAEDDAMLGSGIERGLRMAGMDVDWVRDGPSTQSALRSGDYKVLLLDIGLPGKDGLQVLEWLKTQDLPTTVLVVSARDAVSDRVQGLNLGADDYLTKPFDLDELIARVRVRMRRHGDQPIREERLGRLSVFPLSRQVKLDGQGITLAAREFDLLMVLMEHPGRVYSREQLERRLYGDIDGINSNAVEVHLHHLRRKLGSAWIKNVRGVGYKLIEAV